MVLRLQRSEQRVIVQPMFVLISESIKFHPQIRAVGRLEVPPGNLEKPGFEGDHSIVVNEVGREVRFTILLGQQPVCYQAPRTDH